MDQQAGFKEQPGPYEESRLHVLPAVSGDENCCMLTYELCMKIVEEANIYNIIYRYILDTSFITLFHVIKR